MTGSDARRAGGQAGLTRLVDDRDLLRRRLARLPALPGVYLMRDAQGSVIYVGKAVSLRDRVRSYFGGAASQPRRTAELVDRICDFDFLTCSNEQEALVLECNLIKHYRPRHNVLLKDDKNFLYLKWRTDQPYAAIHYVRRIDDDGARYFGPYPSAHALRSTVRWLRQLLPFRTCSEQIFKQGRVCLDYHIKRCPGPCESKISAEGYRERLDELALFLEGRSDHLVRSLKVRMRDAAARQAYEEAARCRDRLHAIERISDRQKVLSRGHEDQDIVVLAQDATEALVKMGYVRSGKLIGSESFVLDGSQAFGEAAQMSGFLGQYYSTAAQIPGTVLVNHVPEDHQLLENWMAGRRGGKVTIHRPLRGSKRQLLAQMSISAASELDQLHLSRKRDRQHYDPLLAELASELHLASPPTRIECYDVSNTQAESAVVAMVVFEAGKPKPEHYRRFRIQGVQGPNDFAMLAQALRRRLTRLEMAQRDLDKAQADESFDATPDLLLIDGGRGQLSAVAAVLQDSAFPDLAACALAKQREEIFTLDRQQPIILPRNSPVLFLVQRIRDETHRFAITYHRQLRSRRAMGSPLDSIEGVGPRRKSRLLRRFGSIAEIRQASVEELVEAGLYRTLAVRVKQVL